MDDKWERVKDYKNAFHNYSKDGKNIVRNKNGKYQNVKYVDKATGQYEVILNRDFEDDTNPNLDDYIVTLPSSTGTFNFYFPNNMIKHMDFDVDTWMDFGSGNGDNTTYYSRKSNSDWLSRGLFGEF